MESSVGMNERQDLPAQVSESSDAIGALVKAEVDIQIATAKKYPRDITAFRKKAESLATLTPAIAESCFYNLPRGNKKIEGPSVRFAEIVANTYTNLKCGARVLAVDEKNVICQGAVMDMENNVYISVEIRRKITDKNGKRFSEDMITMTANAGCAIAFRNAVFKAVPSAYTEDIFRNVKKVAIGSASTLTERRNGALEKFKALGVSEKMILDKFDIKGIEGIGLEELGELIGFYTAIDGGDSTVEDIFEPKVTDAKITPAPEKPAAEIPTGPGPGGQQESPATSIPADDHGTSAGERSTNPPDENQENKGDLTPKQLFEQWKLKLETFMNKKQIEEFVASSKEFHKIKVLNNDVAYSQVTADIGALIKNNQNQGGQNEDSK